MFTLIIGGLSEAPISDPDVSCYFSVMLYQFGPNRNEHGADDGFFASSVSSTLVVARVPGRCKSETTSPYHLKGAASYKRNQ